MRELVGGDTRTFRTPNLDCCNNFLTLHGFFKLLHDPTDLKSTPLAWKEHVVCSRNPLISFTQLSCIQGSTKTSSLANGSQSDILKISYFHGKHTMTISANILTCFGKIPSMYIHIEIHSSTHKNRSKIGKAVVFVHLLRVTWHLALKSTGSI